MVELIVILLFVYTIIKAARRVITPLWALLEIAAWIVLAAVLWYAKRLIGTEAVLTALVGLGLVAVWALGLHVRALREDISKLNEKIARTPTKRQPPTKR
jgi:hypothetical protein